MLVAGVLALALPLGAAPPRAPDCPDPPRRIFREDFEAPRLEAGRCRSARRFEPALFRAEQQGWLKGIRPPLLEGD